jgi:hypothetical protein
MDTPNPETNYGAVNKLLPTTPSSQFHTPETNVSPASQLSSESTLSPESSPSAESGFSSTSYSSPSETNSFDGFSFGMRPCPDTVEDDLMQQLNALPKAPTHEPSANDDVANTENKERADTDRNTPTLA